MTQELLNLTHWRIGDAYPGSPMVCDRIEAEPIGRGVYKVVSHFVKDHGGGFSQETSEVEFIDLEKKAK